MIGALPLGFAEPLVLIGLLTLPVLWWLLRLIPPRPRRLEFPPTRLLLEIAPKEETPARTPWWLTLMRLVLAALVIIAAAGPLWHPPLAGTKTSAPVAILIDDDWAAAATWDARVRTADDIITHAEDDRRAIALIPLSDGPHDISLATAGSARVQLHQMQPVPHTIDRAEALPSLSRFLSATPDVELVWLSDGVDLGHNADHAGTLEAAEACSRVALYAAPAPMRACCARRSSLAGRSVRWIVKLQASRSVSLRISARWRRTRAV
jgi:hypothetical protein